MLPLNFFKQYQNKLDTQYNLLRGRSEEFQEIKEEKGNQVNNKKMMSNVTQSPPLNDQDGSTIISQRMAPGGSEEIRWEIVARTAGVMPATIIAGRLQSENIPARAWQEGAGRALGLTVGILGTGYVAVPEEFVELAQEILADEDQGDWEEE